jgi:hypothetical protein
VPSGTSLICTLGMAPFWRYWRQNASAISHQLCHGCQQCLAALLDLLLARNGSWLWEGCPEVGHSLESVFPGLRSSAP